MCNDEPRKRRIALAVQARIGVDDLVDTLMVHPSLSESLSEAAD